MVAGGFFAQRLVRRVISGVAALLSFFGGVLVLLASVGHGIVASILPIILGLVALFGAWWIYNSGKALLFPRSRLTMSGLVTSGTGVLVYLLGFGVDGLLVLAAGLLAWLATIL